MISYYLLSLYNTLDPVLDNIMQTPFRFFKYISFD